MKHTDLVRQPYHEPDYALRDVSDAELAQRVRHITRFERSEHMNRLQQEALKDVVAILDSIKPGADRVTIFFEVGRAKMTARIAIEPDAKPLTTLTPRS